jgi:hypothetical protein
MVGKKKKSRQMSGGCLLLFALPFAAVGVYMTALLLVKLVEHHKMKSWQLVPAMILDSDLERHDGDDGATYKAVATYEYQFEGESYRGDRVGLHGGSDNVGKFQQRAARELKKHRHTKEPFLARVDPDSPEDSILFTDLRLGMVAMYSAFGLLFGGAGFGMMIWDGDVHLDLDRGHRIAGKGGCAAVVPDRFRVLWLADGGAVAVDGFHQ